jgi:acyl-CoA thioesterase
MTDYDDPQALATAAAADMYERDHATQAVGIEIVGIEPGAARMQMRVRKDMLNGHQTCHGGFIFVLADSAFAFACNSYNIQTVAAGCTIDYLAPGYEGDLLQADAIEQARSGKTGVYDVIVTNQDGKQIALFRGKSHQLKGDVIKA